MMIGVDLAKHVFHLHGSTMSGHVLFRKRLSRGQFLRFMAQQPACTVVMEACGGAHHWARELAGLGHEAKLIAPGYVKPFIKRQKNDANDAEAIVEAAQRPGMRFVEVKSPEQQAIACLFRARKQLVEHRTALVNALRAHLYEFGFAFPAEAAGLAQAGRVLEDAETDLPDLVRELCRDQLARIDETSERIAELSRRISTCGNNGEQTRRLQTMPGHPPGILAGSDAGTKAEDAGGDCLSQQDGPDGLGHDREGRDLPGSGADRSRLTTDRLRIGPMCRKAKIAWENDRKDRGRENQANRWSH
jgi:transposase